MKRIKYTSLLLFVVFIALILAGCGTQSEKKENPVTEKKPEFLFRFGATQPEGHPTALTLYKFKEIVEEKGEGRIKVEVYPAKQLGGNVEMNEAVQQGSLTMTYGAISYMGANFEPRYNVFSLPFIINDKNVEKAYAMMDGDTGKQLSATLEKNGFKVLGYGRQGYRNITNSKKPIQTPSDLEGIKIRLQPNKTQMDTFSKLGANPAAIDFAELYSALQQGVVDAQENPIDIIYTNKFYEVQKYLSITNHFFEFTGIYMNKGIFDKLPADLQQIVEEAGMESIKYQRQISEESEDEYLAKIEAEMEVNKITTENAELFQQKVQSMYSEYVEQAEDKEFAKNVLNNLGVSLN